MLTLKLSLVSDTGLSVTAEIPAQDLTPGRVADELEEMQTKMAIAFEQQQKKLHEARMIYNPPPPPESRAKIVAECRSLIHRIRKFNDWGNVA